MGKGHAYLCDLAAIHINHSIMATIEIITKEDLRSFKNELLQEIKTLLQPQGRAQSKKWLKSQEVRKMLNISPGTLQNSRINATLRYTKIGSMLYYKQEDINTFWRKGLINERKRPHRRTASGTCSLSVRT